MKHPLLFLGLMGFDAASEAAVRQWLEKNAEPEGAGDLAEHPVWRVVDFREADALLIRGAGVANYFGSYLQFLPALQAASPSLSPIGVDLASVKLPFVLSDDEHLRTLGVDTSAYQLFDPHHPGGMLRAIQYLEMMLRPLRALYALAEELTERQQELDDVHTYHLERNGVLDAIVDMPKRRVLLSPNARPIDISNNAWLRRPRSANFAPPNFVECSLKEVGWVYAMHSINHKLPKRYRELPIYVRHNPHVRSSLLYPRHAALMDQLWHGPQTYEQLLSKRPELAPWLERDLDALYLTRSISTQNPGSTSGEPSSSPGGFAHTNPWLMLRPAHSVNQHGGQKMHTISDDLPPLY